MIQKQKVVLFFLIPGWEKLCKINERLPDELYKCISDFHGQEVKAGEFLFLFESPKDACDCAITIQEGLAQKRKIEINITIAFKIEEAVRLRDKPKGDTILTEEIYQAIQDEDNLHVRFFGGTDETNPLKMFRLLTKKDSEK